MLVVRHFGKVTVPSLLDRHLKVDYFSLFNSNTLHQMCSIAAHETCRKMLIYFGHSYKTILGCQYFSDVLIEHALLGYGTVLQWVTPCIIFDT